MKRARFNQGSVVFDKHISKWRFLQWVNGKRKSRVIGTKQEFPTKTAAVIAAHSLEVKPAVVRGPTAAATATANPLSPSKARPRTKKLGPALNEGIAAAVDVAAAIAMATATDNPPWTAPSTRKTWKLPLPISIRPAILNFIRRTSQLKLAISPK